MLKKTQLKHIALLIVVCTLIKLYNLNETIYTTENLFLDYKAENSNNILLEYRILLRVFAKTIYWLLILLFILIPIIINGEKSLHSIALLIRNSILNRIQRIQKWIDNYNKFHRSE